MRLVMWGRRMNVAIPEKRGKDRASTAFGYGSFRFFFGGCHEPREL